MLCIVVTTFPGLIEMQISATNAGTKRDTFISIQNNQKIF